MAIQYTVKKVTDIPVPSGGCNLPNSPRREYGNVANPFYVVYALLAFEGSVQRVIRAAVTPFAAVRAVAVEEYSCYSF
jgi:hypothetical protein